MTPAQVTGVIATQRPPRPRKRATCTRAEGARHLLAAYELGEGIATGD
jgi:hypothetical protein